MASEREAYLTELAEAFLAEQVKIGWKRLNALAPKGETVWIDSRSDQAGVEVEVNLRCIDGHIEVEVIAYDGEDNGNKAVRKAMVSR